MRRWTMRIFVVLGAFLIVAALSGVTYPQLAARKELAGTPPPQAAADENHSYSAVRVGSSSQPGERPKCGAYGLSHNQQPYGPKVTL